MVTLSFKFRHHGVYSSYHRLLAYPLTGDVVVDATAPSWCSLPLISRRGLGEKTWWRLMERRAWRIARMNGHKWVHYAYPEHSYFGSDRRSSHIPRIALSCHLPQQKLEACKKDIPRFFEALRVADAVITMSPAENDYYSSLAPKAKLTFIPHGVDVSYFQPASEKVQRAGTLKRILVVGNMLRDFDLLTTVIALSIEQHLPLHFSIIALRENLQKVKNGLSNQHRHRVTLMEGLSDALLLEQYQHSDALFLPLVDATANNAILEALACGLPIIVSDFPATRAYAGNCARYITPRSEVAAYNALSDLVHNPNTYSEIGAAGRRRAVGELSWPVIVNRQHAWLASIE